MPAHQRGALGVDDRGFGPGTVVRRQCQARAIDPADHGVDHHPAHGPKVQDAGHPLPHLPDPTGGGGLDPEPTGCEVPHRAAVAFQLQQGGSRTPVLRAGIAPPIQLRLTPAVWSHAIYSPVGLGPASGLTRKWLHARLGLSGTAGYICAMSTTLKPSKPSPATGAGTPTVWLDGEWFDRETATVSVYDHGLLYGDGVFEGIR